MPSITTLVPAGLAFASMLAVAAPLDGAPAGAGFRVLYQFQRGADGASPAAGVLKRGDELYGTTVMGGATGMGVVFKIAKDGTETALYTFTGGADGAYPSADLIDDKDGNLYSRTVGGGANGDGTVFRLAPDGTLTTLFSFDSNGNGNAGLTGLVRDDKGNLYGVDDQRVFKLTPHGKEKILHDFNGENPNGDFLMDKSGNLYGTTHNGGANAKGSLWKIAPDGTETTLYSFKSGTDGYAPDSGPVMDSMGSLYGTTYTGGSANCGIVYKLASDGTESVLHTFAGGASDGCHPQFGRLAMDASGNLYGMTYFGPGTGCNGHGCGSVYKVAPDGTETILHSFVFTDGEWPNSSVIADKKGHLYGTTIGGGQADAGVVVRLDE